MIGYKFTDRHDAQTSARSVLYQAHDDEEEVRANARLIDAAPDLYKAAVAALGNITGGSLAPFVDGMELLRLLKAAIAKAEVEPCE